MAELLRLAAFTLDPTGGNPAGVWIGNELPDPTDMQRIATEVGYSETAFLALDGSGGPPPIGSATSARPRKSRSAATPRSRPGSPWPSGRGSATSS